MPKDTPESFENTLLCKRRKFKLLTNQIDDYTITSASTQPNTQYPTSTSPNKAGSNLTEWITKFGDVIN